MNSTVKNIFIIIGGLLAGMAVNGLLIAIWPSMISLPEGVDVTTAEGLKAGMPLFQTKDFIMPFLAHALGTLVGAFIVANFAETNKFNFAMLVGIFFLMVGASMVVMVGGPLWFNILDLGGAYLPMAWLGHKLAVGNDSMA